METELLGDNAPANSDETNAQQAVAEAALQAARLEPARVELRIKLVRALQAASRLYDARREAQAVLTDFPNTDDLLIQIGALFCDLPDIARAEHVAMRLLQRNRGMLEPRLIMVHVWLRRDDRTQANAMLADAVATAQASDCSNLAFWKSAVDLGVMMKQWNLAGVSAERALIIDPDDFWLRVRLCQFLPRSDEAGRLRRRRVARHLAVLEPAAHGDAARLAYVASLQYENGRGDKGASALANSIHAFDRRNADLAVKLSELCIRRKARDRAEALLDSLHIEEVQAGDSLERTYQHAIAHGFNSVAERAARRLLQLMPDHRQASRWLRGLAYAAAHPTPASGFRWLWRRLQGLGR